MSASISPGAELTLWDVDTAAAQTGLSPRFVRRLVSERRVQVVKLGRLVRIRPSDLEHYIESNLRPPATQR